MEAPIAASSQARRPVRGSCPVAEEDGEDESPVLPLDPVEGCDAAWLPEPVVCELFGACAPGEDEGELPEDGDWSAKGSLYCSSPAL